MRIKEMRPKITLEIVLRQRNYYRFEMRHYQDFVFNHKEVTEKYFGPEMEERDIFVCVRDYHLEDNAICDDFSYPGSWDWELNEEDWIEISSFLRYFRTPPAPIVTNGRGRIVQLRKGAPEENEWFVGDGSYCSRQYWKKFCPNHPYVLDLWHLARQIRAYLGTNYKEIIQGLVILADRGDVNSMLRQLEELSNNGYATPMASRLAESIQYIHDNEDGIENASKAKIINLHETVEVGNFGLEISQECFANTDWESVELRNRGLEFKG